MVMKVELLTEERIAEIKEAALSDVDMVFHSLFSLANNENPDIAEEKARKLALSEYGEYGTKLIKQTVDANLGKEFVIISGPLDQIIQLALSRDTETTEENLQRLAQSLDTLIWFETDPKLIEERIDIAREDVLLLTSDWK